MCHRSSGGLVVVEALRVERVRAAAACEGLEGWRGEVAAGGTQVLMPLRWCKSCGAVLKFSAGCARVAANAAALPLAMPAHCWRYGASDWSWRGKEALGGLCCNVAMGRGACWSWPAVAPVEVWFSTGAGLCTRRSAVYTSLAVTQALPASCPPVGPHCCTPSCGWVAEPGSVC